MVGRLPVLQESIDKLKNYIETHKIKKYDHWYTVLKVKFDQPEEIMFEMKLLEQLLVGNSDEYANIRDEFVEHHGINFLIDIIVQSCNILMNEGKIEKFPL